ncbi:hypothetical protein NG791_04945 [Laspinema sp. D1]|uniref:hypothetical protein n=1 Tax=Laspinema palackyanum TaxID=3231601 RepID=UPI00348E77D4|nr:hypothetical protein [Laspinema sp. D2b]
MGSTRNARHSFQLKRLYGSGSNLFLREVAIARQEDSPPTHSSWGAMRSRLKRTPP